MKFYERDFLLEHCTDILRFYDDVVLDPKGGYFQNFYDDGKVYDPEFKQLVSSARIVVNYCRAGITFEKAQYFAIAQHGLDYINQVHWHSKKRQFAWALNNHQPLDMTQQAYGYAFVLLAYSWSHQAGLTDKTQISDLFDLLEVRFWQQEHGLYADEMSEAGVLDKYRGQNANMHLCEALIAAYQATKQSRYLHRAITLAQNITIRQADLTDGFIWEHYTESFQIDWQYNINDPKNLYRPWGFQGGHHIEWAKLLLQLNRLKAHDWMVEKALWLFETSWQKSWDEHQGGLIYGFDYQGKWCDDDKYFWVQAEALGASALLYQTTNQPKFLDYYEKLWHYCWQHMVDHQHGAWYRVLGVNNQKYSNEKSTAGAKCDYHTLAACFDILQQI